MFVDSGLAADVFAALPKAVLRTDRDLDECRTTGQVRLWWGITPIDVFTNTTDFHRAVAHRAVGRDFGARKMPFLGCSDLAVFKAFFDRTKDWADIEAMAATDSLDVDLVIGALVHYLGADDARIARLRAIATAS